MRHVFRLEIGDDIRFLMTPFTIKKIDIKAFAFEAHEEQGQRYGDQPYSVHLEDIHNRLLKQSYTLPEWVLSDPELTKLVHSLILELSYSHDIIEDTKYEMVDLLVFGRILAEATEHISDVTIGVNRKERKRLTNIKHSLLDPNNSVAELIALIVKPEDRLSNWNAAFVNNDKKKIKMYKKEYIEFKAAVYREGLQDLTWQKLDFLFDGETK